jgi:hypothetical protein
MHCRYVMLCCSFRALSVCYVMLFVPCTVGMLCYVVRSMHCRYVMLCCSFRALSVCYVMLFVPCTVDNHFTTLNHHNARTSSINNDILTPNITTCFSPQRITVRGQLANNIAWNVLKYFQARSLSFAKRLWASCPSVRPIVHPSTQNNYATTERIF